MGKDISFSHEYTDSLGRLRIAEMYTLFDSKQLCDNQPLFWDDQETSGSGTTSTYSSDRSSTTMAVSANTAGTRVRQTFMRFNYQSGKSQLVLMTGILNKSGGGTGIKQRVGLYDDDNGLYIFNDEGAISIVLRSSTTGSPVEIKIPQDQWNIDALDGNGTSGVTIDFTHVHILVVDFFWGVGAIRFGFVANGKIYYVHKTENENILDVVYMSTPNLPIRYEISNDGTGVASEMEHIGSSVSSEGGKQENGIPRYKSTEGSHVVCDTEDTIYAIVGIRLKTSCIGETVNIESISILEHKVGQFYEWMLIFNPTVAGSFVYSDETNSAIQTAKGVTANTVTGGIIIDGGHGSTENATIATLEQVKNTLHLGADIQGNVDELVLCVRPIGSSTDMEIEGSITWRELS